jgi:hypothetical protein
MSTSKDKDAATAIYLDQNNDYNDNVPPSDI